MQIILEYFPGLSTVQRNQLEALQELYNFWNARINVISRKDMENFYERHVLHSLSVAKAIQFREGTHLADIGTGGGFPGIPLAILFPQCHFTLVDSIGKKITVVKEIVASLGLTNVEPLNKRAENIDAKFHFLLSRAVTSLPEFVALTHGLTDRNSFNELQNGILYLKGGDIDSELIQLRMHSRIFELSAFFHEDFFATKKLVHLFK